MSKYPKAANHERRHERNESRKARLQRERDMLDALESEFQDAQFDRTRNRIAAGKDDRTDQKRMNGKWRAW